MPLIVVKRIEDFASDDDACKDMMQSCKVLPPRTHCRRTMTHARPCDHARCFRCARTVDPLLDGHQGTHKVGNFSPSSMRLYQQCTSLEGHRAQMERICMYCGAQGPLTHGAWSAATYSPTFSCFSTSKGADAADTRSGGSSRAITRHMTCSRAQM